MDLTESMVRHIAQEVFGSAKVQYNEEEIDLESAWTRLHIVDAVKEAYRCRLHQIKSDEEESLQLKNMVLKLLII